MSANPFELAQATHHQGPECGVKRVREALDTELRKHFDEAMANKLIIATVISRTLAQRGHRLRADSIRRHRSGSCACG